MLYDEFLAARCEADPLHRVRCADLYQAYVKWVRLYENGQLIPASRRRFTAAIKEKAARLGVKYGPYRFGRFPVARGFDGLRLIPELGLAAFIPSHISVGYASRIAETTSATVRNWIKGGRIRDVVRESERKTLVPIDEIYRIAGAPPERLAMARIAAKFLTKDGHGDLRDLLRAACFAPTSEWGPRLSDVHDRLKTDNIALRELIRGMV